MTNTTLNAVDLDINREVSAHAEQYRRGNKPFTSGHRFVTTRMCTARAAMERLTGFASIIEVATTKTSGQTQLVACDQLGAHFLVQWAALNDLWFEEIDNSGTPINRVINPQKVKAAGGKVSPWTPGTAIGLAVQAPPHQLAFAANYEIAHTDPRFEFGQVSA